MVFSGGYCHIAKTLKEIIYYVTNPDYFEILEKSCRSQGNPTVRWVLAFIEPWISLVRAWVPHHSLVSYTQFISVAYIISLSPKCTCIYDFWKRGTQPVVQVPFHTSLPTYQDILVSFFPLPNCLLHWFIKYPFHSLPVFFGQIIPFTPSFSWL